MTKKLDRYADYEFMDEYPMLQSLYSDDATPVNLTRCQVEERIRLTHDGWGKMPAGTFGTVLRVFEQPFGVPDYAILWDTGIKDCVAAHQIERLSPLEQLASIA